jgi:hypothetical protein
MEIYLKKLFLKFENRFNDPVDLPSHRDKWDHPCDGKVGSVYFDSTALGGGKTVIARCRQNGEFVTVPRFKSLKQLLTIKAR